MEKEQEHIAKFIAICTELVEGKYTDAGAKISGALRAVAGSAQLTELFTAVTQEFDYPWAKSNYLREGKDGYAKGEMLLPAGRTDILAFVFCLFVEIDAGALSLGDFLLHYCYVDGSYTASYSLFAERVIRPFRDIVCDCFPAAARAAVKADTLGVLLASIGEIFGREKALLDALELREEEKTAGACIVSGVSCAIEGRDREGLKALLAGFYYFLRYIGGENEDSAALFELAAKL